MSPRIIPGDSEAAKFIFKLAENKGEAIHSERMFDELDLVHRGKIVSAVIDQEGKIRMVYSFPDGSALAAERIPARRSWDGQKLEPINIFRVLYA